MYQVNSQRKRVFFIIGVVCLFLFIGYVTRMNFIRRPIEIILSPIMQAGRVTAQWISRIPKPLQSKSSLLESNDSLIKENERLELENALLRTFQEEEKITKRMQSFFASAQEKGIQAHVIGKSLAQQHFLIIDAGADQGIAEGYAVITENGILIGTVETVFPRTAHVLLLTDTSQHIAVKVQNETSSPGVIKGEFGLALKMELIPQNDILEKNQTVVTSAINPLIPPNLLLGTITDVQKKEGSVFQEAKVVSPLQLDRIEIVSVIIPAS